MDAIVGFVEKMNLTALASSPIVRSFVTSSVGRTIMTNMPDSKTAQEAVLKVVDGVGKVREQLPSQEQVVTTTKEVSKKTTDQSVGFLSSLFGAISSATESLKNKAIS